MMAATFLPKVAVVAQRLEMVTRTSPIYVDLASYAVDQLRLVGIEATVKQLDTAVKQQPFEESLL